MVRKARERMASHAPRVRLWNGDACAISAPDATYDAVFDFGIIHHIPSWRPAVIEIYRSRPAYQQNDYLAWIARAKRPATKEKRLLQMLDELTRGDVYMKMPHRPNCERKK